MTPADFMVREYWGGPELLCAEYDIDDDDSCNWFCEFDRYTLEELLGVAEQHIKDEHS